MKDSRPYVRFSSHGPSKNRRKHIWNIWRGSENDDSEDYNSMTPVQAINDGLRTMLQEREEMVALAKT